MKSRWLAVLLASMLMGAVVGERLTSARQGASIGAKSQRPDPPSQQPPGKKPIEKSQRPDPPPQQPPSTKPIELKPSQPCPQGPDPVTVGPSQIDPRPLERPLPLLIVRGTRDGTLSRVRALLEQYQFSETGFDLDRGELRARRPDTTKNGAHDDVLIWIDGQAGESGRLRLYVDQARYELVQGKTTEDQRLKQSEAEIQQRFGALRGALRNLPDEGVKR